jgi:membrane-associated phospholipid phosphatase
VALSRLRGRLRSAEPLDRVFIGYVTFTGLLVLIFGAKLGPGLRFGLAAVHLALVAASLWWAGQPRRGRSFAGFVRDAYPLIFVGFLYWELRHLALLFSDGYHDAKILRLEEALFGEQLAMTLSQRFPYPWLSEILHFAYAFYWILLPLTLAALYARGRLRGFRELVYVEEVVFFGCYLVFIFFPVAGPHYEFPPIGGPLSEGFFYGVVRWVLADGGSKGAAFPSSHVAVAVTVLLVTWRHDRLIWAVMLPLVVGLTVGTVYGRFHYGVDAAGGVVAGFALTALARWLEPRLRRAGPGPPARTGNSGPGPAV